MNTVKPCIRCGAQDRYKDGKCRPCVKARDAKWRAANPEVAKAKAAKWYAANTERVKESNAKWRAANPELKREIDARWQAANIERKKAGTAKYRAANSEKVKAASTAWNAANPERVKAIRHKRRARKLAAGGSFTAGEIRKMLKQQKGRCVVCNVGISKSYHIDHIMPLSLGGHNGIQNIQLLCPSCNMSKGAKHPIDFMQENGFLL